MENERFGLSYDSDTSGQTISGCRFIRNKGAGLGVGGAPNVINCLFVENGGDGMGGSGFPQVINCGFYGNKGGGLSFSGDGLILLNTVFSGNSTGGSGGGLNLGWGFGLLLNCTFVGNSTSAPGSASGAVGTNMDSYAHIENSIFRDNVSDSGVGAGIGYHYESPPEVNYSVLHNWLDRIDGVGNVDVDPLFVDADGPDDVVGTEDDNLRLSSLSPVINLGDPDPPLFPHYDGDGHKRILCGRVDMGAYEFGIGDYDCDDLVTLTDFAAWQSCMTGPDKGPYDEGCEAFDFDADLERDIDLRDFAGFQLALPGQ